MMQLLFGKQVSYSLSGVARLGVADHMDTTARSVDAIAAKAGAYAPSLYRVMCMLASLGVFEEGPARHFALTPAGELLKTDTPGSLRYMAMRFGSPGRTRTSDPAVNSGYFRNLVLPPAITSDKVSLENRVFWLYGVAACATQARAQEPGGSQMPVVSLTDRFIATIKPAGARVDYTDSKIGGLMLRVTSSGMKTFALTYYAPGPGRKRVASRQTVSLAKFWRRCRSCRNP
jgi:hypothetical protein